MTISNMTRVESLLSNPRPDITLPELRDELNEISRLRAGARVAFCKRLAIAYMLIVGHRPAQGPSKENIQKAGLFNEWCTKNIYTANGKRYSTRTLRNYLRCGFAANPEQVWRDEIRCRHRYDEKMRRAGGSFAKAVEAPPKVVPITRLRKEHKLSSDVAGEVNELMTVWERVSTAARAQFVYMVAGVRVAV